MGFGSYDESEQERQEMDTEEMDEQQDIKTEAQHDGEMEFEMEDTESALERLKQMRDDD